MTNKLVEEAPYHPGYEDVGFKNEISANELADWLEWWTEGKPYPSQNPLIITMLRQQQIEIDVLKAKLKSEFEYAENLLKAQEK